MWKMIGINNLDRQGSGLRGYSFAHYSKECFTQSFVALYRDAMLVLFGGAPTWRS